MTLIFIIILLIILFWPWISRWIQRYMARRAEDMVRRMAGMPSRKEEERRRKQQQKEYQRRQQTQRESFHRQNDYSSQDTDSIRSMQEYAEDVEFTEIREYSENTVFDQDDKGNTRIYNESQVSDVEFTETKN